MVQLWLVNLAHYFGSLLKRIPTTRGHFDSVGFAGVNRFVDYLSFVDHNQW